MTAEASAKLGRGRPSGSKNKPKTLEQLLTRRHPEGADMDTPMRSGADNEIATALRAGKVKLLDDGRYVWIAPPAEPRRGHIKSGEMVSIGDIKIGLRHRKDMGNLQEFADSIAEIGLLQPIGITPDQGLVFGHRRVEAFKLLGRSEIPARTVRIDSIARGEHDENELRKSFTVSERVAIARSDRTQAGRQAV